MTRKLRNELRFLRLYVVISIPVLALLAFAAVELTPEVGPVFMGHPSC